MVSLLILTVGIPAILYLLLWISPIRQGISSLAQHELSELLGAKVSIGSVEIEPFTRLKISDVEVADSLDRKILYVRSIGGGISPLGLLRSGRLIISDVEIIDPEIYLFRNSPEAPLNVTPILQRLKSSDPDKRNGHLTLALHTAVIRRGQFSYNVLSEPETNLADRFDPNHISVYDINADVALPRIDDKSLDIRLKRLNLTEQSGLRLRNLRFNFIMNDSLMHVSDIALELPVSRLYLDDIRISYPTPGDIPNVLKTEPHTLAITSGSQIYPPDLEPLKPIFGTLQTNIAIETKISGTPSKLKIHKLKLQASNQALSLLAEGSLTKGLVPDSLRAETTPLSLKITGQQIKNSLIAITPLKSTSASILESLGEISMNGTAEYDALSHKILFIGNLSTEAGTLKIDANGELSKKLKEVTCSIVAENVNLRRILNNTDFGLVNLSTTFSGSILNNKLIQAVADAQISGFDFRGHEYRDISCSATLGNGVMEASADISDSLIDFYAETSTKFPLGEEPEMRISASIDHADLCAMGLWNKYPGYKLTAEIDAKVEKLSANDPVGNLTINNISFVNLEDSTGVFLGPITAKAGESIGNERRITLRSDIVKADISGEYDFGTLKGVFCDMLFGTDNEDSKEDVYESNNFQLKATVLNNEQFFTFFNLPVVPIYPVEITGGARPSVLWLSINAPYLRKGTNKLLKATRIDLSQTYGSSSAEIATRMTTKNGDANIHVSAFLAHYSHARANVRWNIDRVKAFKGEVNLGASLMTDNVNPGKIQNAIVDIKRSQLVFNDSVWTISPAHLYVSADSITVDNLHIGRENQFVNISGVATVDSVRSLDVALHNINLDYIFETLNLGESLFFGGTATGNVEGTALLSKQPILRTDNLHVENFSYNYGVFGNADITARWDNAEKAIMLDAKVMQHNGRSTYVDGLIAPLAPGKLDFTFYADHTPVAFMKRTMSAFATDAFGEGSGKLRLYGTMKNVQLEGAIKAHNFGLTIAHTNCSYFTEDSVILTPGKIIIPHVTIFDREGHTATLNGTLYHNYLKDLRFDFKVTDANRMLVYDIGPNDDQNWYGRVYGTGTAEIYGHPGFINVGATMSTAPGSEFTFVLSDKLQAGEYSFLTFTDKRRKQLGTDPLTLTPGSSELDRIMEQRVMQNSQLMQKTNFGMNLNIAVNPNAKINLIMDPVSGDKITAYGTGNPNVIYNSSNDDFQIFGKCELERGTYNFTLQDIIIKNFTLENGSRLNFNGDLDAITMDIHALYSLKANLSDLDESFLNDKEVGRTSVTVQAQLNVNGPLTSPQISFDLKFPTLTSDVERKVHAIVSTEEMMNRQIIYLLALNRFYTPDYMTSTSGKGNELVSVASSTISSQLSNILGQISDKFTLAPNLRSDAGDFSDMEFDLALSSTLLNNRLLLNGNFGYRDQIMNDNQFIGDFDIEYLLNRGGNWCLKAYNHFNDRNLYVKTAMTTQGIGLVFKHDFDFSPRFWRKSKNIENQTVDSDTIKLIKKNP